jgi:chromosome partitioning protein
MHTVAIHINKGGQGKTLLAKSLAVAASLGRLNSLIIDLDTQGNSVSWGKRRVAEHPDRPLPLARFCIENDLVEELERAAGAGCDLVVIDTPPGRSSEALAAAENCDLVLVPFWCDLDSFEGVRRTAGLARRIGKPAFGVLNFVTPNSRQAEVTAREVLETVALPMSPAVLHRYELHKAASIGGLTAMELDPTSRAAADVVALWGWLSAHLQIGTSEHVQLGATAHLNACTGAQRNAA